MMVFCDHPATEAAKSQKNAILQQAAAGFEPAITDLQSAPLVHLGTPPWRCLIHNYSIAGRFGKAP